MTNVTPIHSAAEAAAAHGPWFAIEMDAGAIAAAPTKRDLLRWLSERHDDGDPTTVKEASGLYRYDTSDRTVWLGWGDALLADGWGWALGYDNPADQDATARDRNVLDTLSTALWNEREDHYPATLVTAADDAAVRRMNPSQMKALRRVLRTFWDDVAMGPEHWGNYEFKALEIERRPWGAYTVRAEMGRKGDEGTAAEYYLRTRLQAHLGERGGLRYTGWDKDAGRSFSRQGFRRLGGDLLCRRTL